MNKVMMVIKTSGLLYDDRLRKECITLKELGKSVLITVLEYRNRKESGTTKEGFPFHSLSLLTRKFLPHKRVLILKTLEMYIQFSYYILKFRPNILWVHNLEMSGLIPFGWLLKKMGFIKTLVWDQHELPPNLVFSNQFVSKVFRILLSACDKVVVANEERKHYLIDRLNKDIATPIITVENYADRQFAFQKSSDLSTEIKKWLNGKDYFLAQGGANPDRNLEQLIKAQMKLTSVKLIVVGPYNENEKKNYKKMYGKMLDEKVYFTGFVPQMELINYIDNAVASVIFYNSVTNNSYLCAPNRLYQALSRGIPVVVGSNPTMKQVVERWDCGIVIDGDGSDPQQIYSGLKRLLKDRRKFKKNASHSKSNMVWESQMDAFKEIIRLD